MDANSTATWSTASMVVGTHLVTADYLGDNSNSACSGVLTQRTVGGAVSAPTFVPPGGTYNGVSVSIATATLGAVLHYTTDGGTPTSASPGFNSAVQSAASVTIKATTSLTSSPHPSVLNQSVLFTATVRAASGPTPTGSVTFKNGDAILGTVALSGGMANLAVSNLKLNGHDITATYTGNGIDAGGHSPVFRQIVNP